MSKIVVLGGSGGIGSVAVCALAALEVFDEVIVADIRKKEAEELAISTGNSRVSSISIDVTDQNSLLKLLLDVDVVLNCVGPFYRFGPPVLEAAIRAKVNYVDVCDDLAPTRTMLDMDEKAKNAGISALVGMGNSPGLSNVFVKLCQNMLLDQVEAVDIMHIHGGEPVEGPAVVKHRIHAMMNDIPLFLDGKFISVRQLEPNGQAQVRETDFRNVGTYPVYPYPHPETITLPHYISGLKRATNLGVIFPIEYFHLTQEMVRLGICTQDPLSIHGREIIPLDFAVAHILRSRKHLLRKAGVQGPAGCLKVVVSGKKNGKRTTFVFQLSSQEAGADAGTGIPAAVGAVLMEQGKISKIGVLPPEAAINPLEVMSLALNAAKKLGLNGNDSIHIETIDEFGNRNPLPLPV